MQELKYHPSWAPLFASYKFNLTKLYKTPNIYPPEDKVFRVFEMDVNKIKVLLLGQDPYHGFGQAHGLSFSVPPGVKIPPSLANIYKELKLEFPERNYVFNSGDLSLWESREQIFLLNSSLTVLEKKPGSHMNLWEDFTNDAIKFISTHNKSCVFLLLGKFAHGKAEFIENKTKIVYGIHPSPMAQGFVGSGVFKQVEALTGPINWSN